MEKLSDILETRKGFEPDRIQKTDQVDPMCGVDHIRLTKADLAHLLNGGVLTSDQNAEYLIVITLE